MTAQLGLHDLDPAEIVTPDYGEVITIDARFELWCAANPWVMPRVVRHLEAWFGAGHKTGSLKRVWEVMRHEYGVSTGRDLVLNNDYTSRAARYVLALHPEWQGKIRTRELRAP